MIINQIIDGCKVCNKCKLNLPVDQFHKDKRTSSGLQYRCKSCQAELRRQINGPVKSQKHQVIDGHKPCSFCKQNLPLINFTKDKSNSTGYDYVCKACKKQQGEKYYDPYKFIRPYGLTPEAYKAMLHEQDGKCKICRQVPQGSRAEGWRIDHCHTTGKIRGLLCNGCNAGLGHFADDPVRLAEAIRYLAQN